jgi:hypothetical protein
LAVKVSPLLAPFSLLFLVIQCLRSIFESGVRVGVNSVRGSVVIRAPLSGQAGSRLDMLL